MLCVVVIPWLDFLFFFFFQAEDGIRDLTVTGVQTCALPIFPARQKPRPVVRSSLELWVSAIGSGFFFVEVHNACDPKSNRSEERRVGKECRSRLWAEHDNKKESG